MLCITKSYEEQLIFMTLFNLPDRFIDNIDGSIHFIPGNNQGRSQSQDIALDGFGGKSFFQTLEHDDLSFIHCSYFCFAINDQIDPDMQPQAGNLAHEAVLFCQVI